MKIHLLVLTVLLSCGATEKPNAINTTHKALLCFKNNDVDGVRALLYPESIIYKDRSILEFYVSNASKELSKYGIPSEDKWKVRIDSSILRNVQNDSIEYVFTYKVITIPIFKGYDSTTRLEEARLEFKFDNTGIYLPQSKISDFEYIGKRRGRYPK